MEQIKVPFFFLPQFTAWPHQSRGVFQEEYAASIQTELNKVQEQRARLAAEVCLARYRYGTQVNVVLCCSLLRFVQAVPVPRALRSHPSTHRPSQHTDHCSCRPLAYARVFPPGQARAHTRLLAHTGSPALGRAGQPAVHQGAADDLTAVACCGCSVLLEFSVAFELSTPPHTCIHTHTHTHACAAHAVCIFGSHPSCHPEMSSVDFYELLGKRAGRHDSQRGLTLSSRRPDSRCNTGADPPRVCQVLVKSFAHCFEAWVA